ncbi:hypothetical protein QCB45_01965 [Thiomicrorhabdus sp. ZW0627]|nr:hypothetical protein [Thiomicrorhabdus sp. ZW0627]
MRNFVRVLLCVMPLGVAASEEALPLKFDFNATAIYQHAYVSGLDNDLNWSADLFAHYLADNYELNAHFEANSTPKRKGIAYVIGQSNADAGTALSRNDEGRLQLSEFYISVPLEFGSKVSLGLLDSTAYFDTSRITNDENSQFIASDFVNSPVIDFPDYALAVFIEHPFSLTNTTRLMISSTNGLADNPSRDYSSLFEVNDDTKGIFSILETQWHNEQGYIELGVWLHNGDHEALDNPESKRLKNYGAYLTGGRNLNNHKLEVRAGSSNERVSTASSFASIAYAYAAKEWTFGSAYGYTKTSKYLNRVHDNVQELEVYGRRQLGKHWSLTPSVQCFKHPLYEPAGFNDDEIWTANLRANVVF